MRRDGLSVLLSKRKKKRIIMRKEKRDSCQRKGSFCSGERFFASIREEGGSILHTRLPGISVSEPKKKKAKETARRRRKKKEGSILAFLYWESAERRGKKKIAP